MKQILSYSLLAASLLAAMPSAHAQLMPSAQPTVAGATAGNGSLDRIVAVVEEDVILQSELDEAINAIVRQYASNPGQLPPKDVLARQVLDRLVLMKLQVQRANDQNIHVSDQDIDQAAGNVAQQNKMSLDQLRGAVEQDGYSYAAFRQQLSDQIIAQKLHESVVRDQVTVTDAEVNNLLASPSYKAGEVHLAHIAISTPANGGASDIAAAQAKADEAMKAIKGGMDFNAAAIRFSDAPDALDGGDLGWRRLDEVPPAFADAVGGLKPGETTGALRGPTGFHILKLVDTRAPGRQIVTEYHARQILIKPSEIVTPEQAEKKAQDLYTRIVDKKEDFSKLAKDESKDNTTANNGGDMGWFAKDAWGQAIATQIEQLKDNEVSHPIQTDAGWIVLQRLGTRQSDLTDQLQRDQARQAIGNRKADEAYENYLRELRSTSFVDIRVPELKDPDDKQASASTP
ncbi:MAG: peptidylprolyl isomerase [Luteibacter sp.]|uniref:peptidylprolyl isomerase n=1 Tax=Rhodanobacteraceae TaxID=1775411 RepID=UPI00055B3B53|nr:MULTISPECIES: peptidylprolyl isomerase [Rhodanobacteraceae]MDQ7997848.1 peptidylprolyl isomerase [Luteibacter sp.]MDQ8050409.1 peptidylprolyl isomerase [Luteibacter sp.]MDR6641776.1 peptidyl-prolyl cis-trans isomerase SurA [Luteibacter sp. 1214]SDF97318.1 periplasmic chaperone for outer membrane proteins SurA [Dyella sp. 333MFSha]SKB32682.1 periplasmic chaperone for outer membrane proteins SurA [Luteibacter sp. 22Crub2.1]